jgi:hypothetical protein
VENIITKKSSRGFSINEWISRLFLIFISGDWYGYAIFHHPFLPHISNSVRFVLPHALLFFILFPVNLLFFYLENEEEKKELLKDQFLETHILDKNNLETGNAWFELYYQHHMKKKEWWKLFKPYERSPIGS